jgi:hypothetical protein
MCAAPGVKSLVLAMQLLLGQAAETAAADCDDGVDCGEDGVEGQQGGLTAAMLQQLHLQAPEAADGALAQQQPDSSRHCNQQLQQEQHSGPQAAAAAAAEAAPGENGVVGNGQPGSDLGEAAGATQEEEEEEEQEAEDWPSAGPTSSSSSAGRLVCNELDPVRRGRLSGVLAGYIPGSSRRRVRVTGHDAAKHWAR